MPKKKPRKKAAKKAAKKAPPKAPKAGKARARERRADTSTTLARAHAAILRVGDKVTRDHANEIAAIRRAAELLHDNARASATNATTMKARR